MKDFLKEEAVSLKVCGVITQTDAEKLVEIGVPALGVNFWPKSKRFCHPEEATFLEKLKGRILRVGVFVNAEKELPQRLLEDDLIDFAQFHGDEGQAYCEYFANRDLPYIRAIGIKDESSVSKLELPRCSAILLDAHAPGVYGGTGKTCDWGIIKKVKQHNPDLPVILAGGITTENVAEARKLEGIVALDVASGAESSPGVKDFSKIEKLLA